MYNVNKDIDTQVSKRVQYLIDSLKLNKKSVAVALKVSPSSFYDIMGGKSPWRLHILVKVSFYFNISVGELVCGKTE